jgi:predicted nucleic acid-binding protein
LIVRTVIDASAALNLVMRSTSSPGFMNTLEKSRVVLAPVLFHAEVANALWKYLQAGIIDKPTAVTRLTEARDLVDVFEPDESLCTEALSLAALHDHPVYDALYVVVALRHGAKLMTADKRLARLAAKIDPSLI